MPEIRVKKLLGNLLLMAIAIALISFFVAPSVAFFAIRSAADARDPAGLARLIDYDELRRALRPQLGGNPAAVAPPPSFMDDPIGAVRSRLQQQRPTARAPNPDTYLTPAAIAALTRGEGRYASLSRTAVDEPRNPWPAPTYWGFNRARFAVTDEGGSQTLFTFERRGPFQWTLVHVGLPEGAAPVAPAPRPAAKRP